MRRSLEGRVWQRAGAACEYCQMPEEGDILPFQIDHVVAKAHGGKTTAGNLALACFACNNRKGTNLAGLDPRSGKVVRLFHPRRDRWGRHFRWSGARLVGRTRTGRATIAVLGINLPHRVALRSALIAEGVFPPR
jgi:HNH endonuclease